MLDLYRDRRGNVAMMFAILLPMLLGAVAFAVDIAHVASAKSRLQSALDGAILAASRLADSRLTRDEVFASYIQANMAGSGYRNLQAGFEAEEGVNFISSKAFASAEVPLYFAPLMGELGSVRVEATAFESSSALEVVLVLDNTGSMNVARTTALRNAARALVDILESARSANRKVSIALVPFVTAVNIKGEGFKMEWMDVDAKARFHGVNFAPKSDGSRVNHFDLFDRLGKNNHNETVVWKGCVEARPTPYNFTDVPPDPANPDTLFVPYFAPDEPGARKAAGDDARRFNNSYLNDTGASGTLLQVQRSTAKYQPTTPRDIRERPNLTNGPNRACPTPIVPLTEDFDTLRTAVAGMQYWNGSGTNVSEGLAWGWRVLSPGEPFTQGVPFEDESTTKVVVLLTDGENVVYGASDEAINKSDYGSYGFLEANRFGVSNPTQNNAARKVDQWTLDMCSQLKSRRVEIFTVLLQADTPANRTLYSACASKPENYFPTNDVSLLEGVFRKIGAAVASLYVTS